MQAIKTKYLPVTNNRGSRIKATCAAGSITIPYPHKLSGEEVHAAAAMALVRKLGWTELLQWACGGLEDGSCVFVAVSQQMYCYGPYFQAGE